MTVEEARAHFAYDEWANARYVEVLAQLPPGALVQERISSFPSLLATFAHVVAAEWIWLRRWRGDSPRAFPDWMASPSLESLRARLAAVQEERAALLGALSDADLDRDVEYSLLNGTRRADPLGALFLHVVNHSSFHRGQLSTLLRQAGGVPPVSDLVAYRREHAGA
jgi:uncharacterized damage-inducible protein DinB